MGTELIIFFLLDNHPMQKMFLIMQSQFNTARARGWHKRSLLGDILNIIEAYFVTPPVRVCVKLTKKFDTFFASTGFKGRLRPLPSPSQKA